jgi:hypothetical protein
MISTFFGIPSRQQHHSFRAAAAGSQNGHDEQSNDLDQVSVLTEGLAGERNNRRRNVRTQGYNNQQHQQPKPPAPAGTDASTRRMNFRNRDNKLLTQTVSTGDETDGDMKKLTPASGSSTTSSGMFSRFQQRMSHMTTKVSS